MALNSCYKPSSSIPSDVPVITLRHSTHFLPSFFSLSFLETHLFRPLGNLTSIPFHYFTILFLLNFLSLVANPLGSVCSNLYKPTRFSLKITEMLFPGNSLLSSIHFALTCHLIPLIFFCFWFPPFLLNFKIRKLKVFFSSTSIKSPS